jgi:DNA polymerase I-like protein with 3'-5' exonuclease and polymerase domains
MFFDDIDLGPLKKKTTLRVPPPTPETGWRPPASFPNLSAATVLGFDLERKERDFDHGPGWSRGAASTVGFSIAARDRTGNRGKWYFPIRHEVEPQYNLDPDTCLRWLKCQLETDVPKVGANLLYDVGSLTDDGIYVRGRLHDVQFAEAILDTDARVNLDQLGEKYLGHGKETNLLYEWCAKAYGGQPTPIQRDNIWRASPRLVGPYGEMDADLPIDILEQQLPLLWREGLANVYDLECGLIRLLVLMRKNGVRVDIAKAEKLYDDLGPMIANLYGELFALAPVKIDGVNSPRDVSRIFDYAGIAYPRTEDGNPSFRKDWLKNLDNPIANKINEIREHEKVRFTFLRNYILEGHTGGVIHSQLHPLRSDDGGAKTGRFAGSDPNLQNIPVRTLLGKLIREIFVPFMGHIAWEKIDYSQIEYRYLAHYAVDDGDGSAERLRAAYAADPKTDYHKQTQENVKKMTGFEILRRPIKNMNFGLVYGMSEKKLIRQNGFNPEQGAKVFKAYHAGNPYVRPTMKAAATEMHMYGYITTILNRKIRFATWEPAIRDYDAEREPPLPYELAIRRYGSRIKRAGEHKAINYRLQGSGTGDQIKSGMLAAYNAGVFDVTGAPLIQVHDELGMSVMDESPQQNEAYAELYHLLETCVPLKVPVKVDHSRAPTWRELKED